MNYQDNQPEPTFRNDKKGKYRMLNGDILMNMSWDTKKDAEAWANWNNFGVNPHGYTIIENPDLSH